MTQAQLIALLSEMVTLLAELKLGLGDPVPNQVQQLTQLEQCLEQLRASGFSQLGGQ